MAQALLKLKLRELPASIGLSAPPPDLCDMSSRAPALGPQSVEIPESDEEAAGRRASPKVARVSAGPGPVG